MITDSLFNRKPVKIEEKSNKVTPFLGIGTSLATEFTVVEYGGYKTRTVDLAVSGVRNLRNLRSRLVIFHNDNDDEYGIHRGNGCRDHLQPFLPLWKNDKIKWLRRRFNVK